MTTREIIQSLRDSQNGTPEFNQVLEECAGKIEDFMGGPEERKDEDEAAKKAFDSLGLGFRAA